MASRIFKRDAITQIAREILDLKPGLVALEGPLGAGKTTLTQELVKQLGIKDNVTSPTFILHNSYGHIHHLDCWRMEDFSELINIGFLDMLKPGNIVILEWADKFRSQILDLRLHKILWIKLDYTDNKEERSISYEDFSH
jgi:tRNA threonylcarbamoyladenosine biosynthesis protein TsaE